MKSSGKHPQLVYASLKQRFIALVIDFALFAIVFFPVTKLFKGVWLMSPGNHSWSYGWFITDPLCLIFLLVIILYFVLLEGVFGFTIGKKLTGIKVIKSDGEPPGLIKSLIRNILRIVDSFPAFNILGIYLIVTSSENTRFGDRVAGTKVTIK